MKKYAYYHMYLTDEAAAWSSFLLENFKRMEDCGLLDELEKVYLVLVGKPSNVGIAVGLAKSLSDKYEIIAYQDTFESDKDLNHLDEHTEKATKQINENVTVKLLYDHACREDAYFLYNHSKGITSFERMLRKGDFDRFINYHYWKEYLSWGVIDKWVDCINALNTWYDVAGTNYFSVPEKHYSGNFWWSKSSHLVTLPDPATNEWWFDMQRNHWDHHLRNASVRFKDEMWVCSSKTTKIFNMRDIEPVIGTKYLFEKRATKKLYV